MQLQRGVIKTCLLLMEIKGCDTSQLYLLTKYGVVIQASDIMFTPVMLLTLILGFTLNLFNNNDITFVT